MAERFIAILIVASIATAITLLLILKDRQASVTYKKRILEERKRLEAEERHKRETEERHKRETEERHRHETKDPPLPNGNVLTDKDCAMILGLSGKVSLSEIKTRYRELVRQYHPDKVDNLGPKLKEVAEMEMKRINIAYEYLINKYGNSA